jgi:hypothetical protein
MFWFYSEKYTTEPSLICTNIVFFNETLGSDQLFFDTVYSEAFLSKIKPELTDKGL